MNPTNSLTATGGVGKPCPGCDNEAMTFYDGQANMPRTVWVCSKCGLVEYEPEVVVRLFKRLPGPPARVMTVEVKKEG